MAPLIVITGPTASGKSGLALELAQRFNGEIICADSRTVYKGMDIGTAKPSLADQQRVRHHFLDIVTPKDRFTVSDFQQRAQRTIMEIRGRGNTPFIVGGTGLYIDSVVLEYTFPDENAVQRGLLSSKSVYELQLMLKNQHITLPLNSLNKRHLISALLRDQTHPTMRETPNELTHVVAIATNKEVLEQRIVERVKSMFTLGIIEEAKQLANTYGWDNEAMTGNIYPLVRNVIEGECSEADAIEKAVIRDRQLAKRQITWLKRHDYVRWLTIDEARDYISHLLTSQS